MTSSSMLPDISDLWRLTMEHSPVGMVLASLDGGLLSANKALIDMLGYPPDELIAMHVMDITHPDDKAKNLGLARELLEGRISSYRMSKRYRRHDGTYFVGDLSVALLRDDNGAPMLFISQIVDLSERHAFEARIESAEEEIDLERRRAEAVFAAAAVGLLLLDAEGGYQALNSRQKEHLNHAYPDGHAGWAGQPGFNFNAAQTRLLAREEMPSARAASGEEFEDLLIWIGEQPMTRRALSVSARNVRDRLGVRTGSVLAYQDVTDLMRASKVKDDFVATVSHELRTPLTSALAYLELLEEAKDVPPDVHQQIVAVRRNALRLSRLVADLLYAARATSGAPLIDPYDVDVSLVVNEAIDAARVVAEGAGVAVRPDVPDSTMAMADGMRLRQVVDNLIANAITYTPSGGRVLVALAQTPTHLRLTVSDNGEGIDAADLEHSFVRFFRGGNARRSHVPGTGLGLHIVQTIVEAHSGKVTVESAPGEGTTVRVILPR
ncbi:MAG: ATP-binding protein [Actinomycetes bacterium]